MAGNRQTGGERLSFLAADLVTRVVDHNGNRAYIAPKISCAASTRDTTRAIRNATLITLVTREQCHAAVASVRNKHRVEELIAGGEALWLPLPDRNPGVDWAICKQPARSNWA